MRGILDVGEPLTTVSSQMMCMVGNLLGAGGQGEVYEGTLSARPVAIKWYFPESVTQKQWDSLAALVQQGAPAAGFLWPMDLLISESIQGFGYVMPLREPRFSGMNDLLTRRVQPSLKTISTVSVHLADKFLQLHAKGLCYRDISQNNVFFDPANGDILICDNDNVAVDGEVSGVLGTARFMAPEVALGKTLPTTQTDLYSLAVLLFYILFTHHPLDGARSEQIHCLDARAMLKLYAREPVFLFDPTDHSNEPIPGEHDNVILFWEIYPEFIRGLFTRAFTDGIRDTAKRVRETEWREAMAQLRDSVLYCSACAAESFYDSHRMGTKQGPGTCWNCGRPLVLPPRLRIGRNVIMLNYDSQLYAHHLNSEKEIDFSVPVAEVTRHPSKPDVWGLKNMSDEKWSVTHRDGDLRHVPPGRTVALVLGTKIHFGRADGEIRV
jgi:DNA-binding helix-hairpin-helix protein with protein kinase domain